MSACSPLRPAWPGQPRAPPRRRRSPRAARTTWCRWAAPSASAPTAPSPTSRSFPPAAALAPRRAVREGDFDVIHVHEPLAPLVGWNATLGAQDPGRRHLPRLLDQAGAQLPRQRGRRAPPLQPALGQDRGLRGGGLDRPALVRRRVHDHPQRRRRRRPAREPAPDAGEELRILFVGRPEERKGLPILLTAFNALVEHVPSPADRDRRRRARTSCATSPTPSCSTRSTCAAASPDRRSGTSCTAPTSFAHRRSRARASAWS